MISRTVKPEDIEESIKMEQICFPPHEACSPESMRERIGAAPELFLIAEEDGVIAGFLNGISTEEETFRDAFFTDASLHDASGANVMLLGLDVRPEFRRRGLATELVRRYADMAANMGKKQLILTCLEDKVPMYRKMGFLDRGMANSTWGGEAWHEMVMGLSPQPDHSLNCAVEIRTIKNH